MGLLLHSLLALVAARSPTADGVGRATGAVVLLGGELAVRMPSSGGFEALLDVAVEDGVPAAEAGADMVLQLSADSEHHLHLHVSQRPLGTAAAEGKGSRWTPLAWADYKNTVTQNGWAYLSVKATEDPKVSNDLKMYAAGFLEGFASAKQIRDFKHNADGLMQKDEQQHQALGNVRSLFDKEARAIRRKAGMDASNAVLSSGSEPSDPWWRQARFMLVQAWGLRDAYNLHATKLGGKPISMVDLFVLNSDGETPELEQAYDFQEVLLRQSDRGGGDSFLQQRERTRRHSAHAQSQLAPESGGLRAKVQARRRQRLRSYDDGAWRKFKQRFGRCSALVRLAHDNSDIFVGHTTFSDFSEMNRIFKYYDFPLGVASRRMGFSSYPGVVGSTDDYYVMDSGLVVTETTVSMMSDEAFDKLDDEGDSVPDFMRIMIASRLATTGQEWAGLMDKHATGTYNSQWMVVDYNLFEAGSELKNGTLWVLEQAPGVNHMQDMTSILQRTGFWASENRAFFDDVRAASGEKEAEQFNGQGRLFSADHNPRANIFAKTAPAVQSLADMRAEMRRNRWPYEVDGGPSNTPDHAIAARGDLDKESPSPNGGVDSKVTSACLVKMLSADAICGPTHDNQAPFQWTDATGKELYPGYPHDGMPNLWNFDWVRMTPDGESASASPGECITAA